MLFLTPITLAMPPAIARPSGQGDETVTLAPSDDVWVYPHATDPGRDEAMRVWGAGGRSVAADAADAEEFSYGYLRFTLPKALQGRRLVGATLTLTNVPNDELDATEIDATPLEARPLIGTFDEKGWIYSNVAKTHPDAKVRYGVGAATPEKGKPIAIAIDLMKPVAGTAGPTPFAAAFRGAFARSDADGDLGIALTSGVDVANVGMGAIYKVGTKDAEEARRPKLVLRFFGGG